MTCDPQNHVPAWLQPTAQPLALRLAVLVLFAVAVAVSAARIQRTLHVPPAVPEFNQGLTDFHTSVYFPALGLQHGFNPYSREYVERFPTHQLPPYSPALFWMSYPFSLLSLDAANVVYFVMSCALIVALAASAFYFCRLPLSLVNVFGLATLVLLCRPGHVAILLGQITLFPVLGAVWALELSRRRPILAGLALAFTTLKPTFAIPVIWLLWCRRDFRAVIAGALIGGAAALGGLIPLVANHGLASVAHSLFDTQSHLEHDKMVATETTWTRIDAVALVGKLFGAEPDRLMQLAILAACLLAAGFALWRTSKTRLAEGADSLSALIICATTLACVYHASYDALLLVVPWVAVMAGRLRQQLPPPLQALLWLLLTVPAVNYVSTRVVISKLEITEPLLTPLTIVNSACILAVMLLSLGVALYRKPQVALSPARTV
jgi:hypothetical protein